LVLSLKYEVRMDEHFVNGFKDELEKIAKMGFATKALLGGTGLGLAGVGVASHAVARGSEKGRVEAMTAARRRRQLLGY
jgi:hypothetical protein